MSEPKPQVVRQLRALKRGDQAELLAVIDQLREQVANGAVIGVFVVANGVGEYQRYSAGEWDYTDLVWALEAWKLRLIKEWNDV